ncbi:MAG: PKD domain-containing protein [Bacteroidetes bacterium]|nr:MAG: PKD domain-containing protein [Bacteroidota bacterium]
MKKIANIIFLFFISHQFVVAQVNNDCIKIAESNRLVCGAATFSDNSNGVGVNDFVGNNGKGCLQNGEKQSAWYAFKVATPGTLTFTIQPSNQSDDYDFAVWGPFSSDIASSCSNLGQPIRCNFSATTGNTGLSLNAPNNSEDASGGKFSKFINVQAGEVYILLVDNFEQSNSGFSLVWNGVTSPSGVNGGGGTSGLAVSTASFSPPTIACNKVIFSNQSGTCEGVLTYQWNFGDGSPIVTDRNPTYFYQNSGTYTVTLTTKIVSTAINNGKTETFTRSITIIGTPPSASFVDLPDKICGSASPIPLKATGTPANGGVAFTIFPNGNQAGQIANATTFNPMTLGAGTHRVRLTYTSPNDLNCVFQTFQNVIVHPTTPLTLGNINEKYCINAASVGLTATPLGGQFTITTEANTVLNTNIFNPTALGVGTHIIKYTFIDANACENTITKSVKVNPLPTLTNQLKPSYCVTILPFTIVATPSSSTFTVNGNPITQFSPTALGVGNFTIVQTAIDENGCSNTKTQMVEIVPQTIYSEMEFDLKICPANGLGESIEILTLAEEQALSAQGKQVVYQWSNGSTGRTYQVRSLNDNGTLIGLAIDQSDCPTRKTTFNLDVSCNPELFIPTAFSPNGDNLNDFLEIFGKEFTNLEFKIYSRWGELIFVGYSEKEFWDGKRYGLNAPDGTYIWSAVYENILYKGKKIYKKGFTTITR